MGNNNCYRNESANLSDVQRPQKKETKEVKEQITEEDFNQFCALNKDNTEQILTNNGEIVNIDDFILLKVIGKGSFGKVMLVEHKMTRLLYAMKVLLKNSIKNERQKRHTITERQILERSDNEFLVRLHYAFQSEQKLYFVVDFVGGGELFYYLRKYIRFNERVVQFYAAEILLALDFLHKKKIIYRDLKPENILVNSDGHIKITDFGLSKILDTIDQKAYSLCGTPEYLAPEIITSSEQGYTTQCDWWSFGAVVYEMLTGAPPFYSTNRKEIIRKILSYPIPIPDYLSEEATSLLKGLLVLNPLKRLGIQNDARDIMNHPFFRGVDFEKVARKECQPPTQFQNNQDDLKYFDPNLLKLEVKDTPVQGTLQKINNFENFTYQKKKIQKSIDVEHDEKEDSEIKYRESSYTYTQSMSQHNELTQNK